jgi:hypothetical protein
MSEMSSKAITKIALDIIMSVLFVTMIFAYDTGLAFHEIAGLFFFAIFATHISLNWAWVKSVTKNLLSKKIKKKSKLLFALNTLLLITVCTIIVTGIMISRVVFEFGLNGGSNALSVVHKWTAYACLGFFAIHIALNWRFVSVSVRKMSSALGGGKLRKSLQALGVSALAVAIVYSLVMPGPDQLSQQASATNKPPVEAEAIRKNDAGQVSDGTGYATAGNQDYTLPAAIQVDNEDTVSLSEYLSNMFCTGCDKHCPLLNLKCDKGETQLQAATIQYQKL